MDRFRVLKGLVGLVLLLGSLGDGLLAESDFLLLRTFNSLVVRGRVRLALQSRVISVKSGPGALLGRLEPRDLRRRVVDGLLELLTSLGSQAGSTILGPAFGFLGFLLFGLVRLICGLLLEGLGFLFGFRGACVVASTRLDDQASLTRRVDSLAAAATASRRTGERGTPSTRRTMKGTPSTRT